MVPCAPGKVNFGLIQPLFWGWRAGAGLREMGGDATLVGAMVRSVSARPRASGDARVKAVLGPTNTGKTHLAIERMCAHSRTQSARLKAL